MNPARISTKCIPEDVVFTEKFGKWICSLTGGSRTKSHENRICSRVMKFIQLSQDDVTLGEIQILHIDHFLGSMTCLTAFLQHLEEGKSIGYSICWIQYAGKCRQEWWICRSDEIQDS